MPIKTSLMVLCATLSFCGTVTAAPIGPESESTIEGSNTLTAATANSWANLVLKGVDTEFPNKMPVTYISKEQIRSPRENFPAFYGCYDWHSSVHGHWLLARLLKRFPEMESAPRIRRVLSRHLSEDKLRQEALFFSRDEQKTFERMYGWSWYLRLVMELDDWDDPDARNWRSNLRPLETVFVDRVLAYLPLLTFPIRTGQHTDTGFALGQVLDYARSMHHTELEKLVLRRAKEFYASDVRYPVQYEPSGHDFFSSCWNEADLMRRVLSPKEFERWLARFVPDLASQLDDGTISPVPVSDMTDPKLVHLAGLNLNRAWCLRSVANALTTTNPLHRPLTKSAERHLADGLAYINSGHYEGDHWLATFGLYAITNVATDQH